jgi:hypothetical protein
MLRDTARWHLVGLALFACGFAGAGIIVATGRGSSAGYYAAVVVGLVGATVLARQGGRVASDVQAPPIWSPRGLTRVADGAAVPAMPVLVVFYTLIVVSIVGNVVIPLATR